MTTALCLHTPLSLQHVCRKYNTGTNPVLIRIDTKAGHGAGKSTVMVIAEQTDKWAFMFQNMGLPYTEFTK